MKMFSLGYRIRRAQLCYIGELKVLEPDLDVFCIPVDLADELAVSYAHYLEAVGILKPSFAPSRHSTEVQADLDFIRRKHVEDGSEFRFGRFAIGPAITFMRMETGIRTDIITRWCMTMEYVIGINEQVNAPRDRIVPKQAEAHHA